MGGLVRREHNDRAREYVSPLLDMCTSCAVTSTFRSLGLLSLKRYYGRIIAKYREISMPALTRSGKTWLSLKE